MSRRGVLVRLSPDVAEMVDDLAPQTGRTGEEVVNATLRLWMCLMEYISMHPRAEATLIGLLDRAARAARATRD